MPGVPHEAAVQVLHENPDQIRALLAAAGIQAVPAGPVVVADSNLSVRPPIELRSDQVFVIGDGDSKLAVVSEPHTEPPDAAKWRTWGAYLSVASVEHQCPAMVLVIALREDTYQACRNTIFRSGPLSQHGVAVLGRRELASPVPNVAPHQWAALAAATGALNLRHDKDQIRALDALAAAPSEDRRRYSALILDMALLKSASARTEMETRMKTAPYRETFLDVAAREVKADALLTVLEARGVAVPAEVRDKQILTCTSEELLETWLRRAGTATTINDVIDGLPDAQPSQPEPPQIT